MGLDILRYGGCAVRLSIQGCLILWLGLFSSSAFSALYKYEGGQYEFSSPELAGEAAKTSMGLSQWNLDNCAKSTSSSAPSPTGSTWGTCYYLHSTQSWKPATTVTIYWKEEACNEIYSHQPDPITGEIPEPGPCSCESGWKDAGSGMQPRCIIDRNQEAEECFENGQIYDNQLGYCVLDCPNGQLNGVCLQDTADNSDTCDSSAPDYKGSIGFGNEKQNICLSDTTCEGGSLGVVNNVQLCIPDDYGPPTCSADAVLVMDEYGWVCESLNDQPEPEPEPPEEPNIDTDGDGEPDEYDRANDPTSVDKGLDKVQEGISDTNTKLEGTNNRLDKVTNALDGVNENLKEGLGTANQTLEQINTKLDDPADGYNTDGLGDAPSFGESMGRLQTAFFDHPTIAAVTTFPILAKSTSCPVFTIPATDFFSAQTMDIHCSIFEDYRGQLSVLFMFFWTVIALFIFLRA